MRFAVFFSVLFILITGLSVYIHRRASDLLRLSPRGRRALSAVLASGVIAIVLTRAFGRVLNEGFLRVIASAGYAIVLAVLLSSVLLALVDLPRAVAGLLIRLFRKPGPVDRAVEVPIPASSGPAAAPALAGGEPLARNADNADPLPARNADNADPLPARNADNAESLPEPKVAPKPGGTTPGAGGNSIEVPRRSFLAQAAAGSALLAGTGSSLYATLFGRYDYVIEEVAIPIPGLPKSLDGFAIVQLSDIHIGLLVGERELSAAVDLARKARPDVVVLTGDLIDSDARFTGTLGQFVRRLLPLAREGVVAIPGNHDYFAGVDETLAAVKSAGAHVLRNSGRVIGGSGGSFAMLGVDDVWAARITPGLGPDVRRAMASVPRDLPRVLLCHNPVYYPEAAEHVALQLSGHTHGGQVNLVVRPADLVLPHGYVAGLYQRGDSRLYINRGFGTAGPPARIGSPPEVTRVVLVAA